MLRSSLLTLLILAGTVSAAPSAGDAVPTTRAPDASVVRFGLLKPMKAYGANNYQPGEADITTPLKRHLAETLSDIRFEFVEYTLPELGRAVREHRVDFALMSAGQYVETRESGAYALASVYTSRFPDPNRFTAALFVTTDRHPNVRTLADMKGLRAAFNSRANFINYQIPLAEIERIGENSDAFFKEEVFTHDRPPEVLRLMREGKADIGAFRVCEYETLMKGHPELAGRFRPVGIKSTPGEACLRSTDLYPGWTVARTAPVDPTLTKRMVKALLNMPVDPESGMGWSVATEFERVNAVFRDLRAGPYEHLREWTLKRVWQEYSGVIVAALMLLIGRIIHWVSVERLAQRRARELNDAYLRQRDIEDKALKAEERLSAMSKLGVVSQLSSIFAHEMGQPLSAIRYRTRALRSLVKDPNRHATLIDECLRTIDEQTNSAARILQKVRDYAKGQTSRNEDVRLDLLMETTAADLRRSGRLTRPLAMTLRPVTVRGDPLELGLAVLNILKNAAEAVHDEDKAGICATIDVTDGFVRLEVQNDGRPLSRETLAEHLQPMRSGKTDGIGLGLVIISSIAEAHGGRFSLEPRPQGGATALLTLPAAQASRQPSDH